MLRVVADANVLVSAALARSPQAPSVLTLDAALDGRIELVTSPLLLREVAMVLARPRLQKYLSAEEATRFLADLAAQTILLVDPNDPPPAIYRDPRDDYLVALATSSRVEASSREISTFSRSSPTNSALRSSHRDSSPTGWAPSKHEQKAPRPIPNGLRDYSRAFASLRTDNCHIRGDQLEFEPDRVWRRL